MWFSVCNRRPVHGGQRVRAEEPSGDALRFQDVRFGDRSCADERGFVQRQHERGTIGATFELDPIILVLDLEQKGFGIDPVELDGNLVFPLAVGDGDLGREGEGAPVAGNTLQKGRQLLAQTREIHRLTGRRHSGRPNQQHDRAQ